MSDAASPTSGSPPHPTFTLVLGGGGYPGIAYLAGTLRALQEAGVDPARASLVIGTSAGAVVGALLRSGVAPDQMVDVVERSGLSGRLRRLIPRSWQS